MRWIETAFTLVILAVMLLVCDTARLTLWDLRHIKSYWETAFDIFILGILMIGFIGLIYLTWAKGRLILTGKDS